jgi:hypothetical protein
MVKTDPEKELLALIKRREQENPTLRARYLEAYPSHRTVTEHFQRLGEACGHLWRQLSVFPAALVKGLAEGFRYDRALGRLRQVLRRKP